MWEVHFFVSGVLASCFIPAPGTWSARSHLPALQASSDVELTAVCTTRADSAEAARRAWGARLAFDDWRKMVASPEIEAVAVVVRVPSHYQPTKAALEAGKHVYCEWPLGRRTAEAVELTALAEARGLVTAIGLQARVNPAVMHLKELLEAGFVDEVMAVHVSLLRDGVLTRPPHRTWQRDAELGANTLTIANGHTVDAMRFVTGDFSRLSAVVATQTKQWLDTGTNGYAIGRGHQCRSNVYPILPSHPRQPKHPAHLRDCGRPTSPGGCHQAGVGYREREVRCNNREVAFRARLEGSGRQSPKCGIGVRTPAFDSGPRRCRTAPTTN
jgi:hypothetical protein